MRHSTHGSVDHQLGQGSGDRLLCLLFYKEPLPEGPAKGAVLSRDTIEQLLDEYYELRGWDISAGLPTQKKLNELGLRDVADELLQLGKLPGKQSTEATGCQ